MIKFVRPLGVPKPKYLQSRYKKNVIIISLSDIFKVNNREIVSFRISIFVIFIFKKHLRSKEEEIFKHFFLFLNNVKLFGE